MEVKSNITLKAVCYHCGRYLPTKTHQGGDNFCSPNCISIYKMLFKYHLCEYYNFNQNPFNQYKSQTFLNDLYDPKKVAQLVNYKHNNLSIITFHIPAIGGSGCVWLLTRLHQINSSISSSRVDLLKKQVVICFNHYNISLRLLVNILNQIGYQPIIPQ